MSDIMRRIVTLFEVAGENRVRAALGQMRGGFAGLRREQVMGTRDLQNYGNQASQVDRQLRAMGTTLRYTLAGGAIFGGARLVGQLSGVQQQLGLISAISPTAFSGIPLVGQQLTQFGEQAEDAAFRALVPISEFNEGLVNLVSTVQDVPRNQVVPILEEISKTAKLSLTPVEEATKGISGLMVAFRQPVNIQNTQRLLAQYQRTIFSVPGGAQAGPQIIQQLPQLAAVSRLAALNPDQMFGLLTTVLRAGGTPATSVRGMQYLVQGLAQPPSDESRKALAGIGITPGVVQREGGVKALFRLIQEVRRRGIGGNIEGLKGLDAATLDQLEGIPGGGQLAGLGITGAGAEFARTAVGRIHGVRSLILLASQGDKAIADLQQMGELGASHQEQLAELRGSWDRFHNRARLREAAMAVDQMGLDLAQAFEPIFNFMVPAVTGLRSVIDEHSNASAYGALGAGGAFAAYRMARRRGLGPLGRVIPIGAAVMDTAQGMGAEDRLRGDSPTNPVWVAVAYALSGPGAGGAFGRRGTTTAGDAAAGAAGGAAASRGLGRFGRFGRIAGRLGIVGGIVALPQLMDDAIGMFEDKQNDPKRVVPPGHPALAKLAGRQRSSGISISRERSADQQRVIEAFTRGWINADVAEQRLNRLSKGIGVGQGGKMNVKVEGRALVDVTSDGKTKRVSVPLELVPGFTLPAPQTRGQPKTYRGN